MLNVLINLIGVIALAKANFSSTSIIQRVFLPIIVVAFLSFKFIDFTMYLKRKGVYTGSPDDNIVELLTTLYSDRKSRYDAVFGITLVGSLLSEVATLNDLGALAYSLIKTFNKIAEFLMR